MYIEITKKGFYKVRHISMGFQNIKVIEYNSAKFYKFLFKFFDCRLCVCLKQEAQLFYNGVSCLLARDNTADNVCLKQQICSQELLLLVVYGFNKIYSGLIN